MKNSIRFRAAVAIAMGMAVACTASACGKNQGASADAAPNQGDAEPAADTVADSAVADAVADSSTADGDGDDGLEPIRVVGGGADNSGYHDLVVVGQEFVGLDGKIVTIRTGRPATMERLGSGQVRVQQGGFMIRLPAALEDGLYKQKVVHLDADGDRSCGAGDLLFTDFSANQQAGLKQYVMMVSPTSRFSKVDPGDITRFCDDIRSWP